MESKKYQIKSVRDMIDCTNEANIDNFLKDLKGFLTTTHMLIGITELVDKTEAQKEVGVDVFTWIDDGKNSATISIVVKK